MMMSREAPRPDTGRNWEQDAACRGQDPNLFHPTPITQYGAKRRRPKLELKAIAWAKSICAGCPVGAECERSGGADTMSIRNGRLPEERHRYPTDPDGRYICGTDAGYRAHYRRGDRGGDVCGPCREAHAAARTEWLHRRGGGS